MILPIESLKDRFVETLSSLQEGGRLVLTAPTGSGKSTRIPLWSASAQASVLVIEPRRVAARTLATWVAQSLGESVGETVGYSIRFESKHTDKTRILFVTPGVARRFLVDRTLERFSVVIFDEFHERSWETDALLAILAAQQGGPKLVIMSATLAAAELVSRYQATLLEAEGRTFPVTTEYDDADRQELTVPSYRSLSERVARACRRVWNRDSDGSVLCFLPGLGSMREVADSLGDIPTVLLHGTYSQKEQARAFDTSQRKVVLATNVAESSLTIPDVTTVIDSGLEKRQIHQSGYVALATVPIALSSADQRKGRAGRVRAGHCLRLWSESGRLEATRPPDICRMELDDLVLFMSALPHGLETPAEWVDEPPEFAWVRARGKLHELGLIDSHGRLTEVGRKAQLLPVDGEWGRLLTLAPPHLRHDLCDLCALASARRNPLKSTRSEEVARARKDDWGEDLWQQALGMLRLGEPSRHALESESLAHCRRIAGELAEQVEAGQANLTSKPHPELKTFLARTWPARFFLLRNKRNAWGNGEVECRLARGEELPEEVTAAFFLQVEPVVGRGLKVELQARWGLPVSLSLLREAGLGEPRLSKIRWREGVLTARVVCEHAGRELGSGEQELSGKALRRGLVTLALERRWKNDLMERLEEEMFYHRLARLLDGEEMDEPDLGERLLERLEELGVEQSSDLELLEDEDFLNPTLESYQMEKLQKDYPRLYSYGGISFLMEYSPRLKKVVLNSLSQTKGVKVNPRLLPRWNGWKVELHEKGRVTLLR